MIKEDDATQKEKRTPKQWAIVIAKRALTLLGPIVFYAVILLMFWAFFPSPAGTQPFTPSPEYIVLIGLMIAYLVPPFGKETIIPAALIGGEAVVGLVAGITGMPIDPAHLSGYPLWIVVVGIVTMDIAVSLFITLNFDLLLKIPVVGAWLRWIMRSADKIINSKKWIKDLSSAGLLLFMYIPLQGSGAMTTSVIARLLNYQPLLAVGLVTLGSIMSSLTVALGISSVVALWQVNPLYGILLAVAIVAVIILIALSWGKIVNKIMELKGSTKTKTE